MAHAEKVDLSSKAGRSKKEAESRSETENSSQAEQSEKETDNDGFAISGMLGLKCGGQRRNPHFS